MVCALFVGQKIMRLPDGRLQLITVAQPKTQAPALTPTAPTPTVIQSGALPTTPVVTGIAPAQPQLAAVSSVTAMPPVVTPVVTPTVAPTVNLATNTMVVQSQQATPRFQVEIV